MAEEIMLDNEYQKLKGNWYMVMGEALPSYDFKKIIKKKYYFPDTRISFSDEFRYNHYDGRSGTYKIVGQKLIFADDKAFSDTLRIDTISRRHMVLRSILSERKYVYVKDK